MASDGNGHTRAMTIMGTVAALCGLIIGFLLNQVVYAHSYVDVQRYTTDQERVYVELRSINDKLDHIKIQQDARR